jgi:hypothetical protein
MEQKHMPERYREAFYNDSGSPTPIWLPDSTILHHACYRHIRHILSTTTKATLACLAAEETDNAATAMLTPYDCLDEWRSLWWAKPPQELTHILPITPHVQLTRMAPGKPKPLEATQRAFLSHSLLPRRASQKHPPTSERRGGG